MQQDDNAKKDAQFKPAIPADIRRGECVARCAGGRTVRAWSGLVEHRGLQRRWLLRGQVFDRLGEPDTEAFALSSRPSHAAIGFRGVALRDRRFALLWLEAGGSAPARDVCTRLFDLNGHAIGEELRLGATLSTGPAALAIAGAPGEGHVIAWVDGVDAATQHLCVQLFDVRGEPWRSTLRVGSAPVESPCGVRLTRLETGGFVLSWSDAATARAHGQGATLTQLFDATGERIGGEHLCRWGKK